MSVMAISAWLGHLDTLKFPVSTQKLGDLYLNSRRVLYGEYANRGIECIYCNGQRETIECHHCIVPKNDLAGWLKDKDKTRRAAAQRMHVSLINMQLVCERCHPFHAKKVDAYWMAIGFFGARMVEQEIEKWIEMCPDKPIGFLMFQRGSYTNKMSMP